MPDLNIQPIEFTIYANKGEGWEYFGTFYNASNCIGRSRELVSQGYKVEIASNTDPVERDYNY